MIVLSPSSGMMEAVRPSETSVEKNFTRQYNPEDSSEHHTRRRENLKSHTDLMLLKSLTPCSVAYFKVKIFLSGVNREPRVIHTCSFSFLHHFI
jgi:hypothetical protein